MATSAMNTSAIDTEKWETGIDATATDIKEVKAFVDWRLSIYKENGWKGFDLWESFVDDFESFTKDILDDLGKDRLKKIRDYLRENGVYVRKEARKPIADGLLGVIHEPTPSKWPTNETTDPTDDPTNDPTDDPTDGPADDSTPALPLLSTTTVRITQAELPLPTNFTAPPTNVAAPPTDVTATSTNITAPPMNATAVLNDLPTAKPASPTNTIAPLTSAPNTRPTEARTTYGKDLVTLAKMYTEESKYNGEDDNFDPAKIKGFPTTLRGIALDFYYRNKATYITFDGIG